MSLSVVTIVANRAAHLGQLAAGLQRSLRRPDELIVVDMGSTDAPRDAVTSAAPDLPVRWLALERADGRLPLAGARNAGAATARGDALVFLDVDCIPARRALGDYEAAIGRGGLVCGPVRYLQRFWERDLETAADLDPLLTVRSQPNPARPTPTRERVGDDHELFWSLAFGLSRATWDRIGGFDESYAGYGAEDTDFAFSARRCGVPMRWIPGATAFHQFHRSWSPPRQHLDTIVENSLHFRERWGVWPMRGWLARFADEGLIRWDPAGEALALVDEAPTHSAPVVASVPASHPYTRAVHHDHVELLPDSRTPWWPHPVLEARWPTTVGAEVDAVHIHFGFEHRSVDELRRWCADLRSVDTPLVVTVHDLEDPHAAGDLSEHRERLHVLLGAAAQVITLTPWAAEVLERDHGRRATVIAHPQIVDPDLAELRRPGPPRIGIHFKAFRANLAAPDAVLPALAAAARSTGAGLVVTADAHADPSKLADIRAAAARSGVDVHIGPRLDDAELVSFVGDLDVLVLPYRRGTHSGIVELCRDVGTRAVVPDRGAYHQQSEDAVVYAVDGQGDPDEGALREAVIRAVDLGAPRPVSSEWRAAQLREVRDAHEAVLLLALDRADDEAGVP